MNREQLRWARTVATESGFVATVGIFMAMGVFCPRLARRAGGWGGWDCPERALKPNLAKLSLAPREIAACGIAEGLKASFTDCENGARGAAPRGSSGRAL
jgi:hypothetical protein